MKAKKVRKIKKVRRAKKKVPKRIKGGCVYKCSWNKSNPFRAYFNGNHVGYYKTEAIAWAAIRRRKPKYKR